MEIKDSKQKIVNVLNAKNESLPMLIHSYKYRRNKVSLGRLLLAMTSDARARAMHAWFVKNDMVDFKNYCYLATKLTLASVGQVGGATFELTGDILYALLSDNPEVIKSLSEVETDQLLKERNNPKNIRSMFYMFQLAMRGDDEALEKMIHEVAMKGKKDAREESLAGKDFFSLLLQRNQGGLEDLIQNRHSRMKSHDPLTEDFMAYLGTVEAKLCWHKKIPVVIESPMIPMQLMPVEPLDNYDDIYDFLKPGWNPPRQGIIGKLTRWFT